MHDTDNTVPEETRPGSLLGLQRKDLAVLLISTLLLMVLMWLTSRWLFPHGTGLGDATEQRAGATWNARSRQRDFAVIGGAEEAHGAVATLSRVQHTVKTRAADDLAWIGASAGAGLRNRDAVQTLARSRAVISFGTGNRIDLGERSLIVIQTTGRDAFVPRRRTVLSLRSGELGGALAAGDGAADSAMTEELEIELPFGRLRVFGGDGARFKIGLNPDDSSSVSIFGGSAELHAAGKTVRIGANQGVTFSASDSALKVHDLPEVPEAGTPYNAQVVRYGDLPPRLRFTWALATGGADFRFVLARDADFEDVVLDRRMRTSELRYDNLEDGRYFWKVSAVRGWQEGPPSAVRKLRVQQDIEPPALVVDQDTQEINGGVVLVRGRTEPGATVNVQGQPVSADQDGRFEHLLALEPGAQLVVVEAIDDVGNIAFESRLIHNLATHTVGEIQ